MSRKKNLFQSTHPMRGATCRPSRRVAGDGHFNPRTPCGVRHLAAAVRLRRMRFQSTHPMRGATVYSPVGNRRGKSISIHAPHAGCDGTNQCCSLPNFHFNPRTPCGVRRTAEGACDKLMHKISIHAPHAGCDLFFFFYLILMFLFQSTHPMRGATGRKNPAQRDRLISIHAPHAGCDAQRICWKSWSCYFNPRTPCGVRRPVREVLLYKIHISIHAPHAGCDASLTKRRMGRLYFNPRTPCGVRP